MRILGIAVAVVVAFGVVADTADAHATSIGFANSGPGSVTVWLGTYNHGGHHLEGSMKLTGVLGTVYGPNTVPFTVLTGTGVGFKPAGLIDGVTNFYVQGSLGNNLPLVPTEAQWLAMFPNLPANHWQGAVFNGLAPGDYQFEWTPIANPTQEWSLWSSSMNGTFHISGQVINPGAPEPASLLLLGAGLVGFAATRRRRKSA